jgi:hypothetical protein
LFTSGEARWLGVQAEGQGQQPRVLLLSVPYALKAADAETVGGLPASAFVLATPVVSSTQTTTVTSMSAQPQAPPPGTVSGTGTTNFIPIWTDNADIGNSVVFQSGTGATAKIGINTTTPAAALDVKGAATIRGLFTLPNASVANATKGSNSQPIAMTASAFNSTTKAAVNQNFRWQAEAAGNNTASPSGTLNLLFGAGTSTPVETGLKINSTGLLTFATGQTFPGAGTISGVTAGTGLTGGGTSGSVTLNLDTTQIPQLNVANTFTSDQMVNGNLSATGVMTGSGFQIGSNLFAFGSYANSNAFLGFSGNTTTTAVSNTANGYLALSAVTSGGANTANGWEALSSNTTGTANTASGVSALLSNTTGSNNMADGQLALFLNTTGASNTASGADSLPHNTTGSYNTAGGNTALYYNTSGNSNTAIGESALFFNATGSDNTALGYTAGPDQVHGNLTNATAIGAFAEVTASNSMVLGSINGVNFATADTNVGIGTTAPAAKLDVHGNANFTGLITFAAGQTFPGAGTITGVTPGTDLIGGGNSGSVSLSVDTTKVVTGITAGTGLTGGGTGGVPTLNLDLSKVPLLSSANTFTNSQTVSGNLTATGVVTGSSYQIGSNLFAFGDYANNNAYLGFGGSPSNTGGENTAIGVGALSNTSGIVNTATGWDALFSNTTGRRNTANGGGALVSNTTGNDNTAIGYDSLLQNTTGSTNTATGDYALSLNSTGSNNTALGYDAGPSSSNLSNSTAIGALAQVAANNSLVLGSINGVNGATASTNVGIGTTAPLFPLHVQGSDATGTGVQSVTYNTSTSGNSFAVVTATSASGVTAEMVADGIGTGPLHTPSGYFGTFTNQPIGLITANAERLHITAAGQVGVGTTAPTHPFQVGQGLGAAFADSWSTYSSRRWKTNIQTLPNALEKVEQLRGVSYDLKDSGKHEIGVIAEEVGKVVPEVVSFDANGKDAQGVDYSRLTAVLIEAVKEQQRQIQEQRKQMRLQQRQIARLSGKVGVLETALHSPKRAKASQDHQTASALSRTVQTETNLIASKCANSPSLVTLLNREEQRPWPP